MKQAHRSLERSLDGGSHELHGPPVDDDVPAEQYAVDDLPGTPRRVVRADGVLGLPPGTVEEVVLRQLPDTRICNAFYDDHRAARRPVGRTPRALGDVTHSSRTRGYGRLGRGPVRGPARQIIPAL
jgi:hypothetical protein